MEKLYVIVNTNHTFDRKRTNIYSVCKSKKVFKSKAVAKNYIRKYCNNSSVYKIIEFINNGEVVG